MYQESQHGKWTLSDSDDDDNVIPPTPPKKPNKQPVPEHKAAAVNTIANPKDKSEPSAQHSVKAEPSIKTEQTSAPPMGSEARQAAHFNQRNPVKHENSSSPALKRKRDTDEGGWNLSSSDDDETPAPKTKPKQPSSSPPKKKIEYKRPPSPHGASYYKEEPSDFFEANLSSVNDTYNFYLNKVSGIEKKYNTGALHIKGNLKGAFVRLGLGIW